MGPPGSGKGSLANKCVSDLGWTQLSTGNLCRKHIAMQSEIGKSIDFAIKSGRLIADEIITKMVDEWLEVGEEISGSVILDGFPRTVPQAEVLETMLKEKYPETSLYVVRLSVPDHIIVQRIVNRYICKNRDCQGVYSLLEGSKLAPRNGLMCDICSSQIERRSDDTEETIKERLAIYHKHEKDMLDFYRNVGQEIMEINAHVPLVEAFNQLKIVMERVSS